jgi:DNA repair protein RecO (recombination protein O)
VFALRNERVFCGMYLNELLVRLLHRNDPHPSLFSAYNQALQALAATDRVDTVLRHFEYQLLGELGYNFDLALDATSGESVHTTSEYCYEPGVGLVPADSAGDSKRAVYTGAQLLAMASGDFDSARAAAKRLLREALAEHLGSAPLRSRELFRATRIRLALPSQLIVSTIASLGDSP